MNISRRNVLRAIIYSAPFACLADGFWIEPALLTTRCVCINDHAKTRLLHFSDLHYKGNKAYLERVIRRINESSPDFACFTGDIVEDAIYLSEALDVLSKVKCPMYGVPGNHDYWSGASFDDIAACFRSTGGEWLPDKATITTDGNFLISGRTNRKMDSRQEVMDSPLPARRILLSHYPVIVNHRVGLSYDLVLAGHSHGGQVRLPFIGALVVPFEVGDYDAGLYDTDAGPLHVSVGIGTFFLPVRFLCPPELTIIEV